jgi:hypothetical protein
VARSAAAAAATPCGQVAAVGSQLIGLELRERAAAHGLVYVVIVDLCCGRSPSCRAAVLIGELADAE